MKKLLLALLFLTTLTAHAQQRLKSFTAPFQYNYMGQPMTINLNGNLTYFDDGRLDQLVISMSLMGYSQDMINVIYDSTADKLKQTITIAGSDETMTTESDLYNGQATTITYNMDDAAYSFDLIYQDNGQLSEIDGFNEDSVEIEAELAWQNGNLQRISTTENGTGGKQVDFEYGDLKSTPALNAIVAYFVEQALTDNSLISFTPVSSFGLTCANLPTKVYRNEIDSSDDTDTSADGSDITISYTGGEDGYPTEVNFDGLNLELDDDLTISNLNVTLEWENDPTGITTLQNDKGDQHVEYYSIDGQRLSQPKHGINIIRHADGTSTKALMK